MLCRMIAELNMNQKFSPMEDWRYTIVNYLIVVKEYFFYETNLEVLSALKHLKERNSAFDHFEHEVQLILN